MQVGKYRLIHKLATGGMAEVFLAKAAGPMGFEKLLVVKRILPHLATEATFVEMFLTEARLAAQLNHPNIVQIFDFGEAEGAYFLAMEYIDGPNLREIIKRSSALGMALPIPFCARVVSAACEGLAFAHGFWDPVTRQPMNIIHRDISPDNILLSRQGAVKVVDFGIAKAAGVSPHTQTGVLKGKLAYMPPEQLRNEALDQRADVYALGVVFYELLTGMKPFVATSDAGMVQAVLFELQVPVHERRPDVPEALQRILTRALSKDRERRYPDCASFQADLEEFIVSTAKPVGAAQIAQIVSMMLAGTEPPLPIMQTVGSAPSNPRLVLPQPLPPLEPTVPSPERTSAGRALASSPRPREAPSGELTSAARPSRIVLRSASPLAPASEVAVEPPPAPPPPPPKFPARAVKGRVWIASAGTLLFLVGGGFAIRHTQSPRPPPLAPPPVVQVKIREEVMPPPVRTARVGMGDRRQLDALAGLDKPPKPPVHPVVAKVGILELRVQPEADFFLDGWQLGRTSRKPFSIEPGRHTLKFVDTALGKVVYRRITVVAGQTTRVDVDLMSEK